MSTSDEPPLVTLVVFVGGVTYSEVSALRFLSNQEECKRFWLIASRAAISCDICAFLLFQPQLFSTC